MNNSDTHDVAKAALRKHGLVAVQEQQPRVTISATPWTYVDPKLIPRRPFLYGTHLCRGYNSATIAHPGVGKSNLVLVEALAMASERNLLGIRPEQRLRVWYWNGEDPRQETDRRIAGLCLHYGIKPDELDGWLFHDSGRQQEIVIARQTRDGAHIFEPVVDALVEEIRKREIDVVILDPFISAHRVSENDNNAIDAIVKKLNWIAEETNCANELVHHSRKTGGSDVSVEDGRGGSAFGAAVRSARVLNVMSQDEAAKAGITDERRRYFRVDNEKRTLGRPSDKAEWYRIESVFLGNGDPADPYDQGDDMGAVTAWKWPDPLAGMTADDFDKVAAVIRSDKWREHPQADNWAGQAVAKALRLKLTTKADKAKVNGMLKAWLNAGSLIIVKHRDEKRKEKRFIEVAETD